MHTNVLSNKSKAQTHEEEEAGEEAWLTEGPVGNCRGETRGRGMLKVRNGPTGRCQKADKHRKRC